jgi:hypothetical protein
MAATGPNPLAQLIARLRAVTEQATPGKRDSTPGPLAPVLVAHHRVRVIPAKDEIGEVVVASGMLHGDANHIAAFDVPTCLRLLDALDAAVELAAFVESVPHRADCERFRVLGDPMGRVSIGPGHYESTARPWSCFCGRDAGLAAWRAVAEQGDGGRDG